MSLLYAHERALHSPSTRTFFPYPRTLFPYSRNLFPYARTNALAWTKDTRVCTSVSAAFDLMPRFDFIATQAHTHTYTHTHTHIHTRFDFIATQAPRNPKPQTPNLNPEP